MNAYPGQECSRGKVAFVYPTVTPETRTAQVRIELANPRPAAQAGDVRQRRAAPAGEQGKRLAVPDSAVLDSGTRQIVLVQRGEGLFEPREVKLGLRGDGYVEVLEASKAGENVVVVSANFLIDAESNLKAAVGGIRQRTAGQQRRTRGAPRQRTGRSAQGRGHGRGDGRRNGGAVTIAHGPVASLKWPGMTMDFKVKDPALLAAT